MEQLLTIALRQNLADLAAHPPSQEEGQCPLFASVARASDAATHSHAALGPAKCKNSFMFHIKERQYMIIFISIKLINLKSFSIHHVCLSYD